MTSLCQSVCLSVPDYICVRVHGYEVVSLGALCASVGVSTSKLSA